MAKYMPKERPKLKPEDKKEGLNENDVPVQRPISARERPFEAYVAAREEQKYDVVFLLCIVGHLSIFCKLICCCHVHLH